jgi:outer membrane murein-binding lipoprotein Lpp
VVRPLLAALVAGVLLLAGCSGGDRPSTGAGSTTTAPPVEALPPEVEAFLERAAAAETTSFTASYDVLRKLGGVASTAGVVAGPGGARVTVGDLVVLTGDHPATCRISAKACVGEVREEQLGEYGIFTRFWSTGPADALRTVVQRDDDGPPVRSTRTAAGVPLECLAVPVGSSLPATSCTTPEGVFGFVDNPAVRYELTSYRVGPPPAGALELPYPVTEDDGFFEGT